MKYLLEEVAKIKMGKMFTSEKCFTREGIPYITEEALNKLSLEDDTSCLPKVDSTLNEQYSFSLVPTQSILLNKTNLKDTSIYQCKTEVCISHEIIAIIPNESILSSDYLFHFIKWHQHNNKKCDDYRLMIELPSIVIQHQVVQVLNAVQQLLANKEYLVTAVKNLPKHFDDTSRQAKHHSNSLYQGFEQLHYLYIAMLNHIFKGDYLHDFPEYHACRKLYSH